MTRAGDFLYHGGSEETTKTGPSCYNSINVYKKERYIFVFAEVII